MDAALWRFETLNQLNQTRIHISIPEKWRLTRKTTMTSSITHFFFVNFRFNFKDPGSYACFWEWLYMRNNTVQWTHRFLFTESNRLLFVAFACFSKITPFSSYFHYDSVSWAGIALPVYRTCVSALLFRYLLCVSVLPPTATVSQSFPSLFSYSFISSVALSLHSFPTFLFYGAIFPPTAIVPVSFLFLPPCLFSIATVPLSCLLLPNLCISIFFPWILPLLLLQFLLFPQNTVHYISSSTLIFSFL